MPGDDVHHQFEAGDIVTDRELAVDERSEAIVVNLPPKRAHEWHVDGRGQLNEDNPSYRDDAPVVCVVYRHALDRHYPHYTGVAPIPLSQLHDRRITFYAFPEPRLIRVGELEPVDIPLSRIRPAPFHARNFDAGQNRAYIDAIAERGHPIPHPLVRVLDSGFELVNGHKRVWASHVAGLDSIPCYTVHQGGEEFARAWARRHLNSYGGDERSVAIRRLQDAGFGSVATDYATIQTDGGTR